MSTKPAIVIGACIALLLGIGGASTARSQSDDTNSSNADKIKELIVERRDTLKNLVEVVESHYKSGQTSLNEVLLSRNQLLRAEIDAADTAQQRQEFRRECFKNFEKLELVAKEQLKSGQATAKDVLAAKAARIKAQVEWLRGENAP